jgi:hypothetical protein
MVSAMTPLRRDVVPFGLVGRDPNVLLVSRCLQPVGVSVEHHCKPISAFPKGLLVHRFITCRSESTVARPLTADADAQPWRLQGLNLVALRRASVPNTELRELQQAAHSSPSRCARYSACAHRYDCPVRRDRISACAVR